MKKLFLVIVLSLFMFVSNVAAEPFLVCDNPNEDEMVTGYMLSFDDGEYIEVSAPLHYDLSHLANGTHDVNAKAKNVWGEQKFMGDLTKNFSSDEMKCKCGCSICNVSEEFMHKLQRTRTIANMPLVIISGCRCPARNEEEGGKDTSDHLTTKDIQCEGVDIRCYYSGDRLKIISAAITAGFRRIGIAKSFIHIGMKKNSPQNVMWVY